MISELKKEFLDFGTAELPKFRPEDLDLYKEYSITRMLDNYGDRWLALQSVLYNKRNEMLTRPEATGLDPLTLETEFNRAVILIRNKFTKAYPLNL